MNKQMTFLLATSVIVSAAHLSASAESSVKVTSPDGSIATAPLTLDTRISFGASTIDIANEGTSALSIPYAKAESISFVTESGVQPILGVTGIRLLHNPVDTQLEVAGHDGTACRLSITSMSGMQMLSIKEWRGEAVNVSSLTPGIYLLNIDKKTIKFIKQ